MDENSEIIHGIWSRHSALTACGILKSEHKTTLYIAEITCDNCIAMVADAYKKRLEKKDKSL